MHMFHEVYNHKTDNFLMFEKNSEFFLLTKTNLTKVAASKHDVFFSSTVLWNFDNVQIVVEF